MIIQDKSGADLEVFAETRTAGKLEVVDFMVAGANRELIEQIALASGLMVEDEDGSAKDAPLCASTWIGYPVETAAVMDEDGLTVITPAVMSSDYLVNWRLGPRSLLSVDDDGYEAWKITAATWAQSGVLVVSGTLRAFEYLGVRQMDGQAITSPLRVWA